MPECRENGWKKEDLSQIIAKLEDSYNSHKGINHVDGLNIPTSESIHEIIKDLFALVFPGFFGKIQITTSSINYYAGNLLDSLYGKLSEQIKRALKYRCTLENCCNCQCADRAGSLAAFLLESLPEIRRLITLDVEAAFDGDPAARSVDEVILSYPFTKAITVHRLAHVLYKKDIPLIPRMMSEWAHGVTGIDIHSGAAIGESFFIDHGTGVVIGETCEIGNHVKLYQGVTLGALSFSKDEKGRLIKGEKRHPTLLDDVTVYANATILGGKTIIGKGAVIGGNTWVTESVDDYTKVSIGKPDLIFHRKKA
ncbi:MAG: serine acetyltransferase [Spirochaetales bacterium]|nr:serine acetyltransferase [Spirochaetales bacterium]